MATPLVMKSSHKPALESAVAGPLYLDCNGSTPVEPEILQRFQEYTFAYPGNCNASHAQGARQMLAEARAQIADWVAASEDGVFFCGSATEANNMAICGLRGLEAPRAKGDGVPHIVLTALEHASVRGPCEYLAQRHGFALTEVAPEADGRISASAIIERLRPETQLVCCMQVNNETGVVQPVAELAQALEDSRHPAYLHVDAAQGAAHIDSGFFPAASLKHPRIDMLTVSGHKMYGICGIAALILKKRGDGTYPSLQPLLLGGAQQGTGRLKGLRSGSIPLALALSLRDAWRLCEERRAERRQKNQRFRTHFWQVLEPLRPRLNGREEFVLPHVCNVILPGIDGESALLNIRDLLSAGRGAACTGSSPKGSKGSKGSPVLAAMGLSTLEQERSLRFSWCHHTEEFWQDPAWGKELLRKLQRLQR
ncbi:MAG: aminotransferase class V-fold PLP-dependent enzyme [Spirochaetota bacterium]